MEYMGNCCSETSIAMRGCCPSCAESCARMVNKESTPSLSRISTQADVKCEEANETNYAKQSNSRIQQSKGKRGEYALPERFDEAEPYPRVKARVGYVEKFHHIFTRGAQS